MSWIVLLILAGAVCLAALGLTLLAQPAAMRPLLGLEDSEAAAYALRIAGGMLFAASLFLGGFTVAYRMATIR
ncbi:hypothetical protein P1X14_19365 [Sphingomonas sp. AOB5]|uniref:hypothetical protein n=1 Tax=Sphingomonas sp. AOB5 TaxID=3034017 RepID=UPI0023FA10E6|nr:hypothetical protein [Sphingomonas sp. AOB5]MDF7777425.1 hypothetical protein [Sphingomonas sp. AOB5]